MASHRHVRGCILALVLLPALPAQSPPPPRGLAVTYAPLDATQRLTEGTDTVRARLLALHVERGESPTPMLSPGMFEARFAGSVTVPVGDHYRFRIAGKGLATLQVNGETVLSGPLRSNRPLQSEPVRLQAGRNQIVAGIESTPFGEATLRVHWSGPDFGFEPIAPDRWQCETDAALRVGELRRQGHQLLVEHRCARCHQPDRPVGESAFGELDNPAADLRRAGARLRADWMARWIADPHAVRADARMPALKLGDGEVADLAAFLGTLGAPLPEPEFTDAQREQGAETFLELGCVACHVAPADDRAKAQLGDRLHLGFLRDKWHGAGLVAFLQAPRAAAPHTRMPDFRLSAEEATALAAWLLAGRPAAGPAPNGDAGRGRQLAARVGCARCHDLGVEDRSTFAELDSLDEAKGCLGAGSGAPDFRFAAGEVAAVRAFLPRAADPVFPGSALFRRAPADFAARAIAAHRCTSCHARDGEPSVWSRVVVEQVAQQHALVPSIDPEAQGVPSLTWAGEKLQPSWLRQFVVGELPSPRPWLHARMPAFPADGDAIVAGLLREHGFAAQDDAVEPPDPNQVAVGQRLVRIGDGFGCVQCHALGQQPAVQVSGREGINFRHAAARLRHDYYSRWLLDPPRIDPESKMPKFADASGRTAFTDAFGGDAVPQFEAIWQLMRTLR